ncbi:MAG: pilus assembly protein CpaB [Thermoleophilaceae bacterium]|nr:pilus assembly protein CpaB [Thermoleophilaceae bacterium]
MSVRRSRRPLALLALAGVCGGLASSEVHSSIARVETRVGPTVPVVVAAADIDQGVTIKPRVAATSLRVAQVPRAFVPPDSLASPEDALGARTARPVPAGAYLTAAHLEVAEGEGGPGLEPGQRSVEVPIAGGEAVAGIRPGARVDVLVTSESRSGSAGDTRVALESVELLGLARAGRSSQEAAGPVSDTTATLLVTARQAVMLTAAANFAREIRLLVRPPGDTRRIGRVTSTGERP